MTSKCTVRIDCSTVLSAMGDQLCKPPSEWPTAKSSEMIAEMRNQIVVFTKIPRSTATVPRPLQYLAPKAGRPEGRGCTVEERSHESHLHHRLDRRPRPRRGAYTHGRG